MSLRSNTTVRKRRVKKAHHLGDTLVLSHSDIHFITHYPEDNPINAINDITERLAHIGAFNGIASSQVT